MWRLNETRGEFYGIVFGIWAIVALYAVLHDQILVSLAPEHFTEYHVNRFGIESPRLHSIQLALFASVSPGLMLGLSAYFCARGGRWPKKELKDVLCGVIRIVVATECVAWVLGVVFLMSGKPPYPAFLYPDSRRELVLAQTVQLTCYLCAAILSLSWLGHMLHKRIRVRNNGPNCRREHSGLNRVHDS